MYRQRYFNNKIATYEFGSINYGNGSIMAYEILGSDFSDFGTTADHVDTVHHGAHLTKIELASAKGSIQYREQFLRQHMTIQEGTYQMQDDVKIAGKGNGDLLEIQFNLSDIGIYYRDSANKDQIAPARSGNIVYLSGDDNKASILFEKNVTYQTFDLHLPLSFLDHYAGESRLMDNFLSLVHHNISTKLAADKIGISPALYNAIQDARNCNFEGLTKRIYLESKAYEIVALLYEHTSNKKEIALSKQDQEAIHKAAALIRDNIEQPFTILELSRMVGINQTKLKSGFKTMFNNTVFGYLQDIRMHQAKRYLLDTKLPIQEIALLLGYQNTSNFSIAFKKTHGYSPGKLREK